MNSQAIVINPNYRSEFNEIEQEDGIRVEWRHYLKKLNHSRLIGKQTIKTFPMSNGREYQITFSFHKDNISIDKIEKVEITEFTLE